MALHALRTEKDSVEFYKSQGDAYDGFRESLLPDRDQLQHYCLPWQNKPKVGEALVGGGGGGHRGG
jgi:hypothetical protein